MTTVATLRREKQDASLTLDELAGELLRQQSTKADYVVDTRRMSFESEGGTSVLTFDNPADAVTAIVGGPVGEVAHRQIGERLGIPRAYYKRLQAEAPYLLDVNVRHWFYNKPETRMLRTLDGKIRAFLSDRYRRIDNLDLMERAVLPVLQATPGLTFHNAVLTDERLFIRALLPSLQREVKVGDIVQAGVQIKNSEIGLGLFEVAPFVWRLDCLNGMVSAHAIKSRHVGKRITEEEARLNVYSQETLAADDAAFFLKARDVVKSAFDEVRFDEIVEQLRSSVSGREIEQVPAATKVLADSFSLSEAEGATLLTQLAAGGDLTQWGAANAVTATAKAAESFERQEELERLGWELATLGTRDWERVALARA